MMQPLMPGAQSRLNLMHLPLLSWGQPHPPMGLLFFTDSLMSIPLIDS